MSTQPVTGPQAAEPANPPPRRWWQAAPTVSTQPVTGPQAADPANPPPRRWWEAAPTIVPETVTRPPAEQPPQRTAPAVSPDTVTRRPAAYPAKPTPQPSSDVIRYGPGVPVDLPASQAGLQAERLWRAGRLPEPPRRRARLRRLLGSALTVILLAASGVVLYLRFHQAPFHVTGVAILQPAKNGCGVDVTGRITTNGAAGTVSYQWVLRPQWQPPNPSSESVVAGQNALYLTDSVEGKGHGSASLMVTLEVLGPDTFSASKAVVVTC